MWLIHQSFSTFLVGSKSLTILRALLNSVPHKNYSFGKYVSILISLIIIWGYGIWVTDGTNIPDSKSFELIGLNVLES